MRKSITALFLFSIVALAKPNYNQSKTSIQQVNIQKVAVLKDTVKKTKVC
jgi:hypothetical protein